MALLVRMARAWLVTGQTPSADGCDSAQLLGGGVFYATAGIGSLSTADCWQPRGALFALLRRGWFRAAIALPFRAGQPTFQRPDVQPISSMIIGHIQLSSMVIDLAG
jgi:hypothetical protein